MDQKQIALLFFLSCSCARIPDHELAVQAQSAHCDSLPLDAGLGEWPNEKWWEEMGNPVLNLLVDNSLQNNPTLKKAEQRLKAACQVALQKRAALFPQLNLDTADLWTHLSKEGFFRAFAPTIPNVVNDFFIGLSFNYEFDFWGKNRDLFKAALGESCARAAEKKQAELILTTSIAYTYVELQFLLRKKKILSSQSANRDTLTQVRRQRKEYALDTAFEPLVSKAENLQVQAELVELDERIAEQIHKLKELSAIGQDGTFDSALQETRELKVFLPNRLSLDLLSRRPDLVAARQRLEAAAKSIDAVKTDFYPNINLYGLLGLDGVFWSSLFRKSNLDAGILPAFHLPIFTAGRLEAQLMEAVYRFNEAVYLYDALILQAAREVADGLTKIVHLQKEIELRQQSVQVAQTQKQIIQKRLDHALETKSSLLNAEDAVLKEELTLASLQYGKLLAEISLIRALGGGFHEL